MEDRIHDDTVTATTTETNDVSSDIPAPSASKSPSPYYFDKGLRKVHPYNHTYLTYAKERWLGRDLLEIFSTEFRDRSKDFYAWAIDNGTVMVNGQVVDRTYIVRNGDLITNVVHRHEPPIIGGSVRIYHRDMDRGVLVVEKKASMPIHATGRYRNNTLLEVMKNEQGLAVPSTANRLDRLVSGIMIIATNRTMAQKFGKDFGTPGRVKKEYVARVLGRFPTNRLDGSADDDAGPGEDIICEEPLLTIDKQIGVNVVHPDGRPSKTIFKRLSYDAETDTSVVSCRPITGRSHQLRVHLQFLGHPIANDPIYNDEVAWGKGRAKGGVFQGVMPREVHQEQPVDGGQASSLPAEDNNPAIADDNDVDEAVEATESLNIDDSLISSNPASSSMTSEAYANTRQARKKARQAHLKANHDKKLAAKRSISLPANPNGETDDLGGGSSVPLVPQAVEAILHLRKVRDEEDNFARYRDMDRPPLPAAELPKSQRHLNQTGPKLPEGSISAKRGLRSLSRKERDELGKQDRDVERVAEDDEVGETARKRRENPESYIAHDDKGAYCKVCGLPLLPDPEPKMLEIWLHAIRYRTDDWDYSSPLPEWAQIDWKETEAYQRSQYPGIRTTPDKVMGKA